MSQRYRRQQRRWAARLDLYYQHFMKQVAKDERKQRGWLSEEPVPADFFACDLPYHAIQHRKLIHKGRKP